LSSCRSSSAVRRSLTSRIGSRPAGCPAREAVPPLVNRARRWAMRELYKPWIPGNAATSPWFSQGVVCCGNQSMNWITNDRRWRRCRTLSVTLRVPRTSQLMAWSSHVSCLSVNWNAADHSRQGRSEKDPRTECTCKICQFTFAAEQLKLEERTDVTTCTRRLFGFPAVLYVAHRLRARRQRQFACPRYVTAESRRAHP
jgi:hypothetical protein